MRHESRVEVLIDLLNKGELSYEDLSTGQKWVVYKYGALVGTKAFPRVEILLKNLPKEELNLYNHEKIRQRKLRKARDEARLRKVEEPQQEPQQELQQEPQQEPQQELQGL